MRWLGVLLLLLLLVVGDLGNTDLVTDLAGDYWSAFMYPHQSLPTTVLVLVYESWRWSTTSQVHDWVVYKLGFLLGSVGHRIKIHKITPPNGKKRGDIEIKDYVVFYRTNHKSFLFKSSVWFPDEASVVWLGHRSDKFILIHPKTFYTDLGGRCVWYEWGGCQQWGSVSRLVFWGNLRPCWTPSKSSTIHTFKNIHVYNEYSHCQFRIFGLDGSLLCPWKSTLQSEFMMTSVVHYFFILTMNHLFCLTNYRRNRINFTSFTLLV
jgi:hypothetical protein